MIKRLLLLFFAIFVGWGYGLYSLRADQAVKEVVLPAEKTLSFIVAGDVMFDRYIRQIANDKGYDFVLENLKGVLEDVDFTVVNLEGSISDYPSVSMYSEFGSRENYIFTFDPEVINILKKYNMVVSLGNNHILNYGLDGLIQTIEYLKAGGVKYFGQVGQEMVSNNVVYEKNGFKVAFVNYNQFINDDKEEVFNTIGTLNEESDFLVVYTHWGDEYAPGAGEVIIDLAHEFIDKGADLVIGSHPHVVQQVETYKNKKIYYSLGNFVFDQYFREETMKGLLVRVDISGNLVEYKDIFVELSSNGQTLLYGLE